MSKQYPGSVLEDVPNSAPVFSVQRLQELLGGLPLIVDLPRTQELLGGVSRQTIYRLVEDGKLRRVKLGRSVRFRVEDILALIEEATR